MKTRQAFFDDFFSRLTDKGFGVRLLYENDIAAEIYAGPSVFCVITQDGDIIYEDYNADQARELEQEAAETRLRLDFCGEPPFKNLNQMEMVNLIKGAYYKVCESADTVMLCRYSELFGYEFVTCAKSADKRNKRLFYRERLFYNRFEAQNSFLELGGFEAKHKTPMFSKPELELIMECCTARAILDSELDGGTETQINGIINKIETSLPENLDLSPRQFFNDERHS